MRDHLNMLATAAHDGAASASRTSEQATLLLDTAITAAGARAVAELSPANVALSLRRVVFTIDELLREASTQAIRAVAYPLADPLSAKLDLAARGTSAVGVAVEVLDATDLLLATASVEYAVHPHAGGSGPPPLAI